MRRKNGSFGVKPYDYSYDEMAFVGKEGLRSGMGNVVNSKTYFGMIAGGAVRNLKLKARESCKKTATWTMHAVRGSVIEGQKMEEIYLRKEMTHLLSH